MSNHDLTDREELIAIATWRSVILDREAGIAVQAGDAAARSPDLEALIAAELDRARAASEQALVPEARVGPFRLMRPLGHGAQAEVWLATDTAHADRRVALKVFHLTGSHAIGMALRLRREVTNAARATAPGVCTIYDTGIDGIRAWIAMRYVEGPSLAQVLAREPGAANREALARRLGWIEAIARTVHTVHGAGVVHRDLKPSNIVLEGDDDPVVLDFGIARALETENTLTATGTPVGTPAYMSPEQIRNSSAVGPQGDVFALGCMLFECITGERPFAGSTPFELQRAILDRSHGDAAQHWRSRFPRDLAIVVDTALAKLPQHRYRSALEFADDLQRCRRGEPIRARPIGPLRLAVLFARRRPAIVTLTVLLAATIVTALVVALSLLAERNRELQRADRAQKFVFHLSDRSRLRQLQHELDEELAIDSKHLEHFSAWWTQATEVIDRLPLHERFLAELRALGTPWPETDERAKVVRHRQQQDLAYAAARLQRYRTEAAAAAAAGRQPPDGIDYALRTAESLEQGARAALAEPAGIDYPNDSDPFMYGELRSLVAELRNFREVRPGSFTRKAGHWLWQKAQRVRPDSIDAHAAAWDRAIDRIAAANGPYHGLRIQPQEGLVPLGPDPLSGLEEFAHVATGSLPSREPTTGALQYAADAAVVLVLLPGGEARIGALAPPDAALLPTTFEVPPATSVTLGPFFLGKHEVTQAQWYQIQYRLPTATHRDSPPPQRLPVETIAWNLAERFARRLSMALPSEAQWEYACRAGSPTPFWFGSDLAAVAAKARILAPGTTADDARGPTTVGSYAPNPFGLFDVHGNVAEWTREAMTDYSLPFVGPDAVRPPSSLMGRVVRGGSYRDVPRAAQSWWRAMEPPAHDLPYVGLRLARPVR